MSEVIAWLESPEGEEWSRSEHYHKRLRNMVVLKEDIPGHVDRELWSAIWVA